MLSEKKIIIEDSPSMKRLYGETKSYDRTIKMGWRPPVDAQGVVQRRKEAEDLMEKEKLEKEREELELFMNEAQQKMLLSENNNQQTNEMTENQVEDQNYDNVIDYYYEVPASFNSEENGEGIEWTPEVQEAYELFMNETLQKAYALDKIISENLNKCKENIEKLKQGKNVQYAKDPFFKERVKVFSEFEKLWKQIKKENLKLINELERGSDNNSIKLNNITDEVERVSFCLNMAEEEIEDIHKNPKSLSDHMAEVQRLGHIMLLTTGKEEHLTYDIVGHHNKVNFGTPEKTKIGEIYLTDAMNNRIAVVNKKKPLPELPVSPLPQKDEKFAGKLISSTTAENNKQYENNKSIQKKFYKRLYNIRKQITDKHSWGKFLKKI